MRRLGVIPAKSDESKQLAVGLMRQRGKKICYHLSHALVTFQATLAALPKPPGKNRASGRAR
jgi:hypothetical protein